MHTEIEKALLELSKAKAKLDEEFAELATTLRSVADSIEFCDRAEASRLLTAAADAEHELLGECEITGALFDALGLEDGAAPRE